MDKPRVCEEELLGWVLSRIRDRIYVLRGEALRNPSVESVRALRDYLAWVREEPGSLGGC